MSRSLRMRSLLAMGASVTVLAAVATPAFAQTTPGAQQGGGNVLEELVVTAQKKEEALQDVPIAVSAFSQDSLEAQKIDGGPNLQLAIPNVTFAKGNFTNSFNFAIRGIGNKAVGVSTDGGVGVHENNAPLQSGNLFDAEFFDVERVEVLRGPQGTLYGRNATGGVVNIITAKPTDTFEAQIRAEIGNYSTQKLRGMINMPIVGDKLAIRVAGNYLKRDGFVTNTYNGHKVDDRDLYSTRVSVMFNPTDSLRTNFMWEHFNEDDSRARVGKQLCTKDNGPATLGGVPTGAARAFLTQGCQNASLYSNNAYGTVNTSGTLTGELGNIFGFTSGDANAGDTTSHDLREIETLFDPIYQSSSDIYQFNLDYDLTDQLTLTAMTSYSEGEVYTKLDYNRNVSTVPFNSTGLSPGGFFTDPQVGTTNKFTTLDVSSGTSKQWSQEIRLQSNFDGPLNFNFGGIYFDYKTVTDYYVIGNSLTMSAMALNFQKTGNPNCSPVALPTTCIGIDPNATPDGSGHNYYDNRSPYHLKSNALFGELYWQANEKLKFTLGLRRTHDDKTLDVYDTVLLSPGIGLKQSTTNPQEKSVFNELTGRFGFDYKLTDDNLLYAFYSKGYKGGGSNPPAAVGSAVKPQFDPEFVNAFELGSKNTLMGGSLMLNATGFYYDYQGYQISKIVSRTSVNENINATVYGLELESVWSPVHNLRLNANVGYLHTKIADGVASIDTMDRTQHNPAYTLVKAGPSLPNAAVGSNCVVTTAGAATIIGAGAGATLPFACGGPQVYQAFLQTPAALGGAGLPPATAAFLANMTGLYNYGAGYSIEGTTADLSGNELPNSPHWTTSVGAQYTWDFSGGWSATLRGDYYRQSKQFTRVYNTAYDTLESWDNTTVTLKVEKPEWGLSIDAYVKNLSDDTPITDAYTTDDSSGLFTNLITLEPRTYGVSVTKSF
ncbi:TonB-dependent receptor [Caulobacter sp. Root487D2Y]|uniref:TonB-dependent receptor n=1 Tax=Caulobacter sp. Root487D2Y TaxID=1736547 RepID=UPI0006F71B39|nr:TonB-dependent receptor [Caulobacter sp. Root487D2Y]KQY27619.1 TonB-dependent receptor [Caulobacter sp. Root487D2Y]